MKIYNKTEIHETKLASQNSSQNLLSEIRTLDMLKSKPMNFVK